MLHYFIVHPYAHTEVRESSLRQANQHKARLCSSYQINFVVCIVCYYISVCMYVCTMCRNKIIIIKRSIRTTACSKNWGEIGESPGPPMPGSASLRWRTGTTAITV